MKRSAEELGKCKVEELRKLCKTQGVVKYHKLRKAELIAALIAADDDEQVVGGGDIDGNSPTSGSVLSPSESPTVPMAEAAIKQETVEKEDEKEEPPQQGMDAALVEAKEEGQEDSPWKAEEVMAAEKKTLPPPSPSRATVRAQMVSSGARRPRMSMSQDEVLPTEALAKLPQPSVQALQVLANPSLSFPDAERVISELLPPPQEWESVHVPAVGAEFGLLSETGFSTLLFQAQRLLAAEPTVVAVPAPAKIFGDIHGQIASLLDLFWSYGSPQHRNGDIRYINYVFLGDFVDRGPHSLEVVTLLLALKVRYPRQVFLVRGNHEDRSINGEYGFLYECLLRLPKSWGISPRAALDVWEQVNDLFDHLPLAAVVGGRLFCVHGGVGNSLASIEQLQQLRRPIRLDDPDLPEDELNLVQDVLWSDPSDNDHMLGSHASSRGEGIFVFGPDIVRSFVDRNRVDIIVRAHQCIEAGVEAFAGGQLWTVFSAHHYLSRSVYRAVMKPVAGRPAAYRDDFFDLSADDLGVSIQISQQALQAPMANWGALLEVDSELRITPKVVKQSFH